MLIILFGGDTHALIPLFAVGVFSAFTLSQSGMVVHWRRERGRGWAVKSAINGLGALTTAAALLVIGVSKFVEGAWITVLAVSVMVMGFLRVRAHYQEVARELSLSCGLPPSLEVPSRPRVVIPISGVHRGIVDAVNFARSIGREVTAVFVEVEPGESARPAKVGAVVAGRAPGRFDLAVSFADRAAAGLSGRDRPSAQRWPAGRRRPAGICPGARVAQSAPQPDGLAPESGTSLSATPIRLPAGHY